VVQKPLPADDPRQRRADIALAREKSGREPVIPIEQGLRATIGYFSNQRIRGKQANSFSF